MVLHFCKRNSFFIFDKTRINSNSTLPHWTRYWFHAFTAQEKRQRRIRNEDAKRVLLHWKVMSRGVARFKGTVTWNVCIKQSVQQQLPRTFQHHLIPHLSFPFSGFFGVQNSFTWPPKTRVLSATKYKQGGIHTIQTSTLPKLARYSIRSACRTHALSSHMFSGCSVYAILS